MQKTVLTQRQAYLAHSNMPIIADMNRSETISDNRGGKLVIYKYDEKHSCPMLTESACFQPMVEVPNFTSPAIRNEKGEIQKDKAGKVVRESSIAKYWREQYKAKCKDEYGDQWKKVFYHGNLPSLN
jgi:hypothetical protein